MEIMPPFSVVGVLKSKSRMIDIVEKDKRYYLYPKLEEEEILYGFFYIWKNSQDIKDDLLPEVNAVLSGRKQFTDIGADIMGLAYVEYETTKLMGSDLDFQELEMSTIEFKEIILEWVAFLEAHDR